MNKLFNLPNGLTVSRIALLPVLGLCFFFQTSLSNIIILSVFIFCCLTDFFDGYFARAYEQTTKLGQILDPIADKALIAVSLLFIIGFRWVSEFSMIPACVILCREVTTSEVRDVVLAQNKSFVTSKIAKLKTALQMTSISTILAAPLFKGCSPLIQNIGEALLWTSSVVALFSGISYFFKHWKSISS